MKVVYSDPTARWVPFALVGLITIAGWFGSYFSGVNFDVRTANVMGGALFVVLIVGVLLQGRVYWMGQVETLAIDGARVEVVTMTWVGSGKRIAFGPAEASDWNATRKHDDATKLSTVSFKVRGEVLSMSFLSPKVVDFARLATLAPAFFATLPAGR